MGKQKGRTELIKRLCPGWASEFCPTSETLIFLCPWRGAGEGGPMALRWGEVAVEKPARVRRWAGPGAQLSLRSRKLSRPGFRCPASPGEERWACAVTRSPGTILLPSPAPPQVRTPASCPSHPSAHLSILPNPTSAPCDAQCKGV